MRRRHPGDPERKRQVRLVVALAAAVLLAGALVYTSFTAADRDVTAGQLLRIAVPGRSYQLAGTVAAGSVRQVGDVLWFRVRDPHTTVSALVRYTGVVPDPFRVGRGVIVTVRRQGSMFVGQRDSLTTKCPSKFQAASA